MNISDLGIALVTNNRNSQLIEHIVSLWLGLGAEVVLSGPGVTSINLCHGDLTLVESEPLPGSFGNCQQDAIDAVRRPYCLITADDIIPVGNAWRGSLPLIPSAIQAARLLSVTGQRWGDWAYWDGKDVFNQRYDERMQGTYITGGSQILSPEARRLASYRGRCFHGADDIRFCFDAQKCGIQLLPPVKDGPVLIHLDRWPPDPSDPERLHVPLRGWLAPPSVRRTLRP